MLYKTLNALRYDEAATLMESMLPAAAIHWSDEGLGLDELARYSPAERRTYHLLLAIRIEVWRGHELSPERAATWQEALLECPDWPAFRRLEATAELLALQDGLEERVAGFLQALTGLPHKKPV